MSAPAALIVSAPPPDVWVPPVMPMFASTRVVAVDGVHEKLSNVPVVVVEAVCELTARPSSADAPKLANVSGAPTCVHVVPFTDEYPVTVLPERINRNQTGTATPGTLTTFVVAPTVVLLWHVVPDGVIPTNALTAFDAEPSRSIRPALA